jgi:hypothetical protein
MAAVGRLNYERIFFRRHAGYLLTSKTRGRSVWRSSGANTARTLPLARIVCDKLAVREYVSRIVGERYPTTLLTTAETGADLDYDELPTGFVANANHGSKLRVLVRDKAYVDPSRLSETLIRLNTDLVALLTSSGIK